MSTMLIRVFPTFTENGNPVPGSREHPGVSPTAWWLAQSRRGAWMKALYEGAEVKTGKMSVPIRYRECENDVTETEHTSPTQ